MTWCKTQAELPLRMATDDLSEAAALAHFSAISWLSSMEEFNCMIPRRMLDAALPLTTDRPAALAELVAAGYWREHPKSIEVVEHQGTIKSSLVSVDKKRSTDRKASQKYRDDQQQKAASVTDAATDAGADSGTESVAESSPRLPTYLTTAVTEARDDWPLGSENAATRTTPPCDICGKSSTMSLVGGMCRRCLGASGSRTGRIA